MFPPQEKTLETLHALVRAAPAAAGALEDREDTDERRMLEGEGTVERR
jgi:hypothetical protein